MFLLSDSGRSLVVLLADLDQNVELVFERQIRIGKFLKEPDEIHDTERSMLTHIDIVVMMCADLSQQSSNLTAQCIKIESVRAPSRQACP